jgi:hypothetical protein
MAACPDCCYPITKKTALFESGYICPNCKQRLVPELSSVLWSILLLVGIPTVPTGLFALVFGVDSLAMMIGFFALLPFGIYTGGTVIRYETGPEELAVDVMIQPGANCLNVHGSEAGSNAVAPTPAFFPRFYTWTFPGCPIRIRVRLEIVAVLQRLIERAQAPGTLGSHACGLLLGDTAIPGVTEVAGIEPLPDLNVPAIEAAIGRAECEVVGFFRALSADPAQPGASLRMTGDDLTLAAGFFNQSSSVVLLIETVETAAAKATFFFWDSGKMLGDYLLMDFPLDAHQLAAQ